MKDVTIFKKEHFTKGAYIFKYSVSFKVQKDFHQE